LALTTFLVSLSNSVTCQSIVLESCSNTQDAMSLLVWIFLNWNDLDFADCLQTSTSRWITNGILLGINAV